jgi:hypothetical protein
MKPDKNTPPPRGESERELADDVYDALHSLGWIVPQTEADVLRAETELAEAPPDLPVELQDAQAVLEGSRPRGGAAPRPLAFPPNADVDSTLARAAREGGRICPEVEEAMRRDRQAAEREAAEREAEDGSEGQEK